MDRWKAEMGRGREERREEKRRRKRKSQKKKNADARKGRKVAKHYVFPIICGSGGSKSRLAKAAGAEPSGQMRDEKLHAIVARSTSASPNVQNTPGSDHFWRLRCRKSARRCDAKRISKSKCTKHTSSGPFLEVEMSKKCTPLWREAEFEVKMYKTHQLRTTFGSWDVEKVHAVVARSTFWSQKMSKVQKTDGYGVLSPGRRKGLCTLRWAKREASVAFPKAMAGVGHLKRIFKDACRVPGAVQKTRSSEMLGGQGADFLREAAFCSIRSSGLLRWFCVTGAALRMTWHHFFVAGAILSTGGLEKIAKRIGTKLLALPFLKEVSQNCFVFDVVKLKNWRSLAEVLRLWRCQLWKMRKSRRIASFLMWSTSKNVQVSQNCFVFDVVNFKKWGSLAEVLRFWCCQLGKMKKSRRIARFSSLQIDK